MFRVLLLIGLIVISYAAPRSRSKGPQLVYDQKQKGDYNIQVHLKDFQIIALLGEDSLGGLGDYDYNYDYADFTVKPPGSSSSKPSESASTSKPIEAIQTTTKIYEKPSTGEPLKDEVSESSSSNKPDEIVPVLIQSTSKPLGLLGESTPADEKVPSDISSTSKEELISSTEKLASSETTEISKPQAADAIPGQIQVQIIDSPDGYPSFAVRKEPINENINAESSGKSDDKKCGTGFTKDKKGRCRRVRKPQNNLPFNFGRLAHLAARFRSTEKDASSTTNLHSALPLMMHKP